MLQSNKPYLKWTRIEGKSYKMKKYEGPDIHLSSALENEVYIVICTLTKDNTKVFCNFIFNIFSSVLYSFHS